MVAGENERGQPSSSSPVVDVVDEVFELEDDTRFSPREHMVAGAIAGMFEHACMFPIDTVKTRMQIYSSSTPAPTPSIPAMIRSIVSNESPRALWRGVGAVLISAGPAHALHFGVYESAKRFLFQHNNNDSNNNNNNYAVVPNAVVHAAAGATATLSSETVMAPMDVVKQRMQLGEANTLKTRLGLFAFVRRVVELHGFSALFAGLSSSLLMAVPFSATQFVVYEASKETLLATRSAGNNSFSARDHCVAGAVAGASASAMTNPLDVVKTRLQTQGERGARRYKGLVDAMRCIWYEEGARGFARGVHARMMFHAPAAAICWTTYELSKHMLGIVDEAALDESSTPPTTTATAGNSALVSASPSTAAAAASVPRALHSKTS